MNRVFGDEVLAGRSPHLYAKGSLKPCEVSEIISFEFLDQWINGFEV
jgi:hypothetical protein